MSRRWGLAARGALALVLILMAMGYVACEGGPETGHAPVASTGPPVEGLATLLEFGRNLSHLPPDGADHRRDRQGVQGAA